ncbi:hypothetical protein XAC3810_520089 [Xanthomonas citri pv. citri]|uniref:Uncharacterized protein n=1 Tax=Xanthomonas citri pv. citri TaxID=611301 RepID=A0A0U5FHK1_XANCI|nr:hypothetical protein XAC9322_520182 [Xanthomonas citri pv. citri]CEE31122.1 hypothetical protein XAC3824_660183 [Xanthomonas citri pv. citri]CEE32472.1 hypothetical protein XAC1083_510183 [Xanthomonas citri pv. citri]CEE41978.1 hypothetical protein XAC3810_520089 [Xanthomonas citri pv. citri]CEE43876.1 hypothetical protein XAC902_680183 [Xanthomonas citri pv. citri]
MPRVDARGVRHRCKRGSNKSHVRLSQLSYQAHFCRRTLRSGPASAPLCVSTQPMLSMRLHQERLDYKWGQHCLQGMPATTSS